MGSLSTIIDNELQARQRLQSRSGMFRALYDHDFRIYFLGQACSVSGNNAQTVAVSWLILELTGSATALGVVTAAQYLPLLIVSPLLGSVIDRFPKRRILIVTQVLAMLVALALGVLSATSRATEWNVGILALCLGSINAIDNPARQALIREIVGRSQLANAVALHNVLMGVARIAGPVVAGFVIALGGITQCFFVNAASFVAILGALLAMSNPSHRRAVGAVEVEHQDNRTLRSGWHYIATTPDVRAGLIVMAIVGTFTYEFWVTIPILVKDVFDRGTSVYASMMTVMSFGSIIGGLMVARLTAVGWHQLMWATAGFGLTTVVVGTSPNISSSFGAVFLMGVAYSAFVALSNAVLQLNTDERFQGRVMTLWTAAFMGSTAIGGPIVGLVAEKYGPRSALVLGGLAALLAAVWICVSNKSTIEPEQGVN